MESIDIIIYCLNRNSANILLICFNMFSKDTCLNNYLLEHRMPVFNLFIFVVLMKKLNSFVSQGWV